MGITFPKFSEAEKSATLATAAKIIAAAPATDPKAAAVSAALATVHKLSIAVALPLLDNAVMVTNMLASTPAGTPEYGALMNANVGGGLDRYREMLGVEVFNAIASDVKMEEPGRTADVAKALADAICAVAAPTEAARGKFLSALGIVKKDLDALAKGAVPAAPGEPTATIVTPPASMGLDAPAPAATEAPKRRGRKPKSDAPAPAPVDENAAMLAAMGLGPAPAAAAPTGGRGRKPQSTAEAAANGNLALAWKRFGDSQDLDTVKRAAEIGVGRATLLNWMNGKTNPKLDKTNGRQHVALMIADIDLRGAALAEAREEFSKVLGTLG